MCQLLSGLNELFGYTGWPKNLYVTKDNKPGYSYPYKTETANLYQLQFGLQLKDLQKPRDFKKSTSFSTSVEIS